MIVNTLVKELLFTTVRLEGRAGASTSVGTGFLLAVPRGEGASSTLLVTNKHVVDGMDGVTFQLMQRAADGGPDLGKAVTVSLGPTQDAGWVGHPDAEVDVTVINLSGRLNTLGTDVYYRWIPTSVMPEPDDGLFIDSMEEVMFVGYPNGHLDSAHLTPIMRRGISATPMELPFDGKPVFLLDGSVFGGSSGSPVFLLDQGVYRTGPVEHAFGTRRVLVGILAATVSRETLLPIQMGAPKPHVRLAQELNLGVVYNWTAILETVEQWLGSVGPYDDRGQ